MASASDQNPTCPNVVETHKELLEMTCKIINIADALKIATVRVKGGATCTCTGDQTLKDTAEELARAASKLNEEVLKHVYEGRDIIRKNRGRGTTRDSGYGSRTSDVLLEYPMQETGEDELTSSRLLVVPLECPTVDENDC